MSLVFSIGGSSKGMMTPIEHKEPYPLGTVVYKYLAGSEKRFVVVSEEFNHYGQKAIAEDLSMTSDVAQYRERKHGGVGIGSFDVVEDLIYTKAQVEFLKQAYADKLQQENEAKQKAEREREEERNRLIDIGLPILEASRPKNAAAVIIARFEENESDPMTDYFGSRTTKVVVLAFSTHTKDLFDEMRSAALHFDETKFFVTDDDCKQYENREKYSGGNGYYLGKSRYSGWQIKKMAIADYGMSNKRLAELAGNPDTWKVPPVGSLDSAQVATNTTNGDVTIRENAEKQGIEIYFAAKPSAEVIAKIKANGWRWAKFNKCWYKKASPAAMEFAKQFVNQ